MRSNSSYTNTFMGFIEFSTLVYHSIVRDVRKGKGNALQAIFLEILQNAMIIIFFYFMIEFLGMKSVAVRGSFVLYVMSGVFLYLTHNKAIGAVGAGTAMNPMLKHAPVSTLMMLISGSLSALYVQTISVVVIMFAANVLIEPFTILDVKIFAFCFFLAWASGIGIGLVFMAIKPFAPEIMKVVSMVYKRANMIFSGKMFLANTLPSNMLPLFTWNPLFHTIDQSRGGTFVNYTPHVTNLYYPIYVTTTAIVFGLMLEHWARKYVSESWGSRG